MSNRFLKCFFIFFTVALSSCDRPFKKEDKIFHGAPQSQGIGGLSFELYKDNRYLIMISGGIGWAEYTGSYDMSGDTIILHNLDRELEKKGVFESNRLIIFRYNEQDSTFWEWKYSRQYKSLTADKTLGTWSWQNHKHANGLFGEGDVYQVNANGRPMESAYHFIIKIDSLKNYR